MSSRSRVVGDPTELFQRRNDDSMTAMVVSVKVDIRIGKLKAADNQIGLCEVNLTLTTNGHDNGGTMHITNY